MVAEVISRRELWRNRFNDKYNLDLVFASLLNRIYGENYINLEKRKDGTSYEINVQDMIVYEHLNKVTETPEYKALSHAFSGIQVNEFYNQKTFDWPSDTRKMVESFLWQQRALRLREKITRNEISSASEYANLMVEVSGANEYAKKLAMEAGSELPVIALIKNLLIELYNKF